MTKSILLPIIGDYHMIVRLSNIFGSACSPEIIHGVGADDREVTDTTETKRRHQICIIPAKAIISINGRWFQKSDTFLPVVKVRLYHLFHL